MKSTKTKPKGLTMARVIIPLVSLGILFALWRTGQKWTVIPVGLLLIAGYVILPRLRASRVARFHRRALGLLASGQAKAVPALVKRSVFLQLFGPRSALDAKLGLAYVQTGQYTHAVACLENATGDADPDERLPLEIGMAKALFVTGHFERAESLAGGVLGRGTRLPELICIVARCRVKAKKNVQGTRSLLVEAEGLSPSPDVKWMIDLVRAEMSLLSGSPPPEFPSGEATQELFLKSWTHLVRGRVWERKGDLDKAGADYREAAKQGAGTFVIDELGAKESSDRAKGPGPEKAKGPEKGGGQPSRRKRRKRR